ncbi:unnamed protein product [Cuscuta campestris]|uniref:Origin of replication complex subunit 6 n=2 Tax=Cuscuta sect. Cleistogrammica TaxID=1824901 RepID=A0A484L7J0_9ASTE|nr:hypothetical protein DM860_005851 [Cuscuta australis]VFQ72335.1 unnamed protein product [Cuscuta campestris]
MDLPAKKLGLSENKLLIRRAAELRRRADILFDSSIIGVGEVCKAIICLEIAASEMGVIFDRHAAIRMSGMSEKAYNRSFNSMQNGVGIKNKLDIRELAIQFGCIRLIPIVQKGLAQYKERFVTSLPPSRRLSADFTRPVFTAVAFYLSAKKHKLKVDKIKLIEICGTSESEFSNVSTSMKDLCFDVFGVSKEKKDAKEIKGNRGLLDALPEKRRIEDGGYSSDEDQSCYKRQKRMHKEEYEKWKYTVINSSKPCKSKAPLKRTKQAQLNFSKKVPESEVEAA